MKEPGKQQERMGYKEGGSFTALQRNGFRYQLSQDNVTSGNEGEADRNRPAVSQRFGGRSANPGQQGFDQMRQRSFSHPTHRHARPRYPHSPSPHPHIPPPHPSFPHPPPPTP